MIIYDNPLIVVLMGLLWYIDKGQSMIIYDNPIIDLIIDI